MIVPSQLGYTELKDQEKENRGAVRHIVLLHKIWDQLSDGSQVPEIDIFK